MIFFILTVLLFITLLKLFGGDGFILLTKGLVSFIIAYLSFPLFILVLFLYRR